MRDWLAVRAHGTPQAPAVTVGGRTSSYAELDARVERTAGRLAAAGVTPGDHVGLQVDGGLGFVTLVHATMRLNAVVVPLDPGLARGELAARLGAADVTLLLADAERAPDAATVVASTPAELLSTAAAESVSALDEQPPGGFDAPTLRPDDTLTILFTSGTTGDPKPVRLSVENVATSAAASAFKLGLLPTDRWYDPLPMYHMGGLAPVYRTVLYGTTLVIEPHSKGFDATQALETVHGARVSCLSLVPTMLRRMLEQSDRPAPFPDSVRFVLVGGAPASRELLERARDRSVPVAPTYGMTEASSQIATAPPSSAVERPESVGTPLMFTELSILDEDGEPVDPGQSGEIVVAGPTVSTGYYGPAQDDSDRYGPYGFRTGDIGYRDTAGRLVIDGRADGRIITGGETVDPLEVQRAIETHPAVETALVVGVPDEEWGERVAALVVGEIDAGGELEGFLADRLAREKRPRQLRVVEQLPRTASGTGDRTRARELLGDSD